MMTTEGGSVTATLSSTSSLAFVQTSSGTNYFSTYPVPYQSTGVAAPTSSDIVAFSDLGTRTLTFSTEVQNLYFAFVSMNGNGYRFDMDFDILSQATTTRGYWGAGEAQKREVVIDGVTYYELYAVTGEPHGVIRFKGAFSSVSWLNPTTEYWHGFTVGIKSSTTDLQNVKGEFLNGATVLATTPTTLVTYDTSLTGSTGTLDATVSSARLNETNAPLTTTGSLILYDVDTRDLATVSVDSVAISGTTSGLALTNAQVLSLLMATTTDTSLLQSSKINWTFNSGSESFNWLANGQELTFTYSLSVNDHSAGTSVTDSSDVTITIVGTNDAPVITSFQVAGAITEGSGPLSRSGSITFQDSDLSNTATASKVNNTAVWTGGTLSADQLTTLDAAMTISPSSFAGNSGTVSWSYVIQKSDINFIAAGETVTLTYYIRVTDSFGAYDSELVTITITGTNDAPVLTDTVVTFSSAEDFGIPTLPSQGSLVSSLTSGITDLDTTNPKSIAITGLNKAYGDWYYLLPGGSWAALSATPSEAATFLLPSTAKLYFKPIANWNGTVAGAITFRAWDQSTGAQATSVDTTTNGAGTAFSTATDTVLVTVVAVNGCANKIS
ncbi:MAG: hypothetical protein EoVTN8_1486 [Fluviibacter phosphoraccumulans EoVTN8]